MIIVTKFNPASGEMEKILKELDKKRVKHFLPRTFPRYIVLETKDGLDLDYLRTFPGVEKIIKVSSPYKLASREVHPKNTVINIKGTKIGGNKLIVIAGPCSIESAEQMQKIAVGLKKLGVKIIRGGAYKPRTSPYSFQGLGEKGIEILKKTAEEHGLLTVTEVLDIRDVDFVSKNTDIVQIGSRNMQNFELLKEVGSIGKPVLLKRGGNACVEELLLSAEYILLNGNPKVILCERGIKTFERETKNTLSLSSVPLIKELSHLPIIVDPSHGTGKKSLVEPMAKASVACGCDGLIIEVHPNPNKALSDSEQQLNLQEFKLLMKKITSVAKAINKSF